VTTLARRWDPLTGEWRIDDETSDDPAGGCALCPDALLGPSSPLDYDVAVVVDDAAAVAETVLYSPAHEVGLADLDVDSLERVIEVWADRYAGMGAREDVGYVLITEVRRPVDGSIHPGSRVFGTRDLPPLVGRELTVAAEHFRAGGTCLLCDVVAADRAENERIVAANRAFIAVVPAAARAPLEVHIVSTRHAPSLLDLSDPERRLLAELLSAVVKTYDTVRDGAPSVLAVHQAPADDGQRQSISHFHIELTALVDGAAGADLGLSVGGDVSFAVSDPVGVAARLRDARAVVRS
jgi:UDPglucose--hexose-1-phosphate uridylyltransferase